MSIWLKKRLAVWVGVSLVGGALLWNGGALRAQSEDDDDDEDDPFQNYAMNSMSSTVATPRQTLTRDEAAKMFVTAMNDRNRAYDLLYDSVSQKSRVQLGKGAGRLVNQMSEQWKRPTQTVKLQSHSKQNIVVVVGETRVSRPLVLVKENGGWGVDLIETYAKWNSLQGAAKAKAIYKVSGAVLAELPQDENFKRDFCQTNLKQIALGIRQYTADWDEKLPPATTDWTWVLQPYVKSYEIFHCPSLPKGQRYGYAFNAKLAGSNESQIDDTSKTVSIYETTILKRNAFGTGENRAFRHLNGANYAFADGHVKWFPKTQTPSFKLKP